MYKNDNWYLLDAHDKKIPCALIEELYEESADGKLKHYLLDKQTPGSIKNNKELKTEIIKALVRYSNNIHRWEIPISKKQAEDFHNRRKHYYPPFHSVRCWRRNLTDGQAKLKEGGLSARSA